MDKKGINEDIVSATKSDANLISTIFTVSCALLLHYFLQIVSCRCTIHMTFSIHLANLVNAVKEFTFNTLLRGDHNAQMRPHEEVKSKIEMCYLSCECRCNSHSGGLFSNVLKTTVN